MFAQGFNEFQTPILTASSPEGARWLSWCPRACTRKSSTPCRRRQQFKQLRTMVSKASTAISRSPVLPRRGPARRRVRLEFYQLDVEMSFVTQEDVFAAIEPVSMWRLRGVLERRSRSRRSTGPTPSPTISVSRSSTGASSA
ncbi:amino acid--tRNA ligase-related protein [Caulobacter segnis]